MGSQRAFTMLETIAALGIVVLVLLAGLRIATLARSPGATADAAAQLDGALALARSLARASGNGATLVVLPRNDTHGNRIVGFRIVIYRGRPTAAGAATLARALPLVADATLREASLGAPPLAIFFRRDGSAVALAHPSLGGSAAAPQLATIAAEPPCPSATGVSLLVTRNGATATRSIPCPVAEGAAAAPQASMTPNPPTLSPRTLVFAWPSAPVQWFAVAEFGYRGWFAAMGAAMQNFTCRANATTVVMFPSSPPYSGPQSLADAQSFPPPPNAVPYAYAASASRTAGAMDDAPAHFPVHPVAAGICAVPIVDAFAQHSDPWGNPLVVATQVMGWLTLANPATGAIATAKSAPLVANSAPLASGKSVTVDASKGYDNDAAGIVFTAPIWSSTSCGSALTFTAAGNNTAGSAPTGTATHAFMITNGNPPSSALTCTGTITDQYGEPRVAFTVNVAASAVASLLTWPAGGVVEAASGATLAMLPMHEPLIAQLFGAEIADATLTLGCKAVALPQGGIYPVNAGYYANDANIPTQVLGILKNQGYSVDATGCVLQNNVPAAQAPLVAYEPGDTSATTPTYQPTAQNCSNIVSLGQPTPLNALRVPFGPQVLIPVIPGTNAGSCSVTVATTPAQASAPANGSGLVPVQVVGSCGTTLAIGQSCYPRFNFPPSVSTFCLPDNPPSYQSGYTGGTEYIVSSSPTSGVVLVNGATSPMLVKSMPLITRIGAGTISVEGLAQYQSNTVEKKPVSGSTCITVNSYKPFPGNMLTIN